MSGERKQIFILSGQSNMAGRGGIITETHNGKKHKRWDGVVPPECQPHSSILRLDAHLHWQQAREPLHADIDTKKACGVGPGMSFVNALRESRAGCGPTATTIGLVPCAVGGTAIREWARGEHLYESMVKRAKAAEGEIKAMLWYQGESDVSTARDADAYQGRMERLICDVREDLGLPLLPVIQVALASGVGKEEYIEKVREVQLGMKLPNVACVDAKGLKLNDDNLHLSTEAQVQLGRMLADAYLCNFCTSSSSPQQQQKKKQCSDSKGIDIGQD